MSTLGDSYEYDVFFSYAWATDTGDSYMRDWCRKIADTIRTRLSQRFNRDGVKLNVYLDRDKAKSGQDLDRELEEATRRSAIFVAMVSDHYASDYCRKEVGWFCEGLPEGSFADHVCILRMQDVSDGKWPPPLLNKDGKPRLYVDFSDDDGQPLNMTGFILNGSLADLIDPINKVVVEISDKMSTIKKNINARTAYAKSQKLPAEPLMFLEAEQTDLEKWLWCKAQLRSVPSIPWPLRAPIPATAAEAGGEYAGCEALLLLRSRMGDDIDNRIKAAYLYRRSLLSGEKQVPSWAVLDEFDDPPLAGEAFEVPHVPLKGDWLSALRVALLNR